MSDNWRPQERGKPRRRRPSPSRPLPSQKPWDVDITGDKRARFLYDMYRTALGLIYGEPMRDSQRLAFEKAYTMTLFVDFYAFIAASQAGYSPPEALARGMLAKKEREGAL